MTFKILKMKGQFADGVGSCALAETEIPKKVQQEISKKIMSLYLERGEIKRQC